MLESVSYIHRRCVTGVTVSQLFIAHAIESAHGSHMVLIMIFQGESNLIIMQFQLLVVFPT